MIMRRFVILIFAFLFVVGAFCPLRINAADEFDKTTGATRSTRYIYGIVYGDVSMGCDVYFNWTDTGGVARSIRRSFSVGSLSRSDVITNRLTYGSASSYNDSAVNWTIGMSISVYVSTYNLVGSVRQYQLDGSSFKYDSTVNTVYDSSGYGVARNIYTYHSASDFADKFIYIQLNSGVAIVVFLIFSLLISIFVYRGR